MDPRERQCVLGVCGGGGEDGGCVLPGYFARVYTSVICLWMKVETVEVKEEQLELWVEFRIKSSFDK